MFLQQAFNSRQRVNLNSERAESFFLENPDILKLSDELSSCCEGKITFQECEPILGAFQLGKTPGNDGIPTEFYKIFWPLIGVGFSSNDRYMKL